MLARHEPPPAPRHNIYLLGFSYGCHKCSAPPTDTKRGKRLIIPSLVGMPKLNCEPFAGSWCYEEGADGWGCGSCQPGESPLDMQSYGCVLSVCMHTDLVFNALADPTRRLMLDELSERNEQTLYELTGVWEHRP